MFVCVYNSRFACACCFPGIFRGRTGWKVRARIKLAIEIYRRNAAGTAAACRLRPDPCIIGLFLTGSSIRRTIYSLLISTSLLYLYYRRCFVLSWLMMAYYTYRVASWVFLLGNFFPSNTHWMLGHRQIWCNKRESIVWWLVSFEYFVLGVFRGWSESLPPIVDLLSISNSLLFCFVCFFLSEKPKEKISMQLKSTNKKSKVYNSFKEIFKAR